jgi:hypothetical protein
MQRYHNSVQDPAGDAVYNALVTVTQYPSNIAATVYSDDGFTVLTQVRTDENGMFEFYAPDGKYNLTVSGERIQTYVMYDVLIDDSLSNTVVIATLDAVANVSALRALTFVTDKTNVSTLGYSVAGDGGSASYYYDASDTTSTDNGYNVIVTNLGQRVKLLTTNNLLVSQAGCVGTGSIVTSSIKAVLDYASTLSTEEPVVDLCGYNHVIDEPLVIKGSNTHLKNGALTADATFHADGGGLYSLAMVGLQSGVAGVTISEISFNCQFLSNGIYNNGANADVRIFYLNIDKIKDFGIKMANGRGNISNCWITQVQLPASRTADGIYVGVSDVKIFNNVIRYCLRPLAISGGTALVSSNHFYNGYPATPAYAANSIIIEILGGDNHSFTGNYLDKGRIILRNKYNSSWVGNMLLYNSPPVHDSVFVFDCLNTGGATFPDDFCWVGNTKVIPLESGHMDFIEFIGSTGGSWTVEVSEIPAKLTAAGSMLLINGNSHFEAITPDGKTFLKTDDSGRIIFDGYGITSKPVLNWGDQEISLSSSGLKNRTIGVGASGTSTLSVEGSRTSTTAIVGTVRIADRRGSNDLTLTDTDLGFYQLSMYGASGVSQNQLRIQSSVPGSATVTDEWNISSNGIDPSTDNVSRIGTNVKRVSDLSVKNIHLFPPTATASMSDGELTVVMAADGQSIIFKSRVAGVVYSSAAITLS